MTVQAHMNQRRFASPVRLLALALLCQALAGCVPFAVSSKQATTLPRAPAAQSRPALPVPVAFIVHLPDSQQHFGEPRHYSSPNEATAWASVLSGYAEPDHFLIAGEEKQPDTTPAFAEFCRTHPVVDINLGWDYESATILKRTAAVGAALVGVSTLGLVPLPAAAPYRAQFRLILPDQAAHELSYAFDRKMTLAPLFLIPSGDTYSLFLAGPIGPPSLLGQVDRTDWRVEEKRRLLAQFLQDARPLLEQYALRIEQQGHTR